MWNYGGWGPMYGWWLMPIIGLICMLIFVYVISRINNRNGGCCGPLIQGTPRENPQQDELLEEVRALRREVEELRKNQNKEH